VEIPAALRRVSGRGEKERTETSGNNSRDHADSLFRPRPEDGTRGAGAEASSCRFRRATSACSFSP
jgi:hypothetical protein